MNSIDIETIFTILFVAIDSGVSQYEAFYRVNIRIEMIAAFGRRLWDSPNGCCARLPG
jgi:hypothetical protein